MFGIVSSGNFCLNIVIVISKAKPNIVYINIHYFRLQKLDYNPMVSISIDSYSVTGGIFTEVRFNYTNLNALYRVRSHFYKCHPWHFLNTYWRIQCVIYILFILFKPLNLKYPSQSTLFQLQIPNVKRIIFSSTIFSTSSRLQRSGKSLWNFNFQLHLTNDTINWNDLFGI